MGGSAIGSGSDDVSRDGETWSFGSYRLQPSQRRLLLEDNEVQLGGRAFDILVTLVENAGKIVTQRELIERGWPGVFVEEANLRVHVANLRKSLRDGENGHHYIETVPRRGYTFVASVKREVSERRVSPAPTVPVSTVAALPPQLGRMVGRQMVVGDVADLTRDMRFVTIVGAGGLGKTTVALAVAHSLAGEFENSVAFIDLGALSSGDLVDVAIASALGLESRSGNPLSELLGFVRHRRLLLVLDNCEHLIESISTLAERLNAEAPKLHILATSREALRVEGENVYLLSSLDHPPLDAALTAAEALEWPAVQLFMERAAASGHRTPLQDDEVMVVASICARLDGIALAIELAAGRVASHGILGTADLLNHRFKLLWQGRRSAAPRHHTMNAVLDWSFNLLTDQDRLVLARLSVFVGTFSLAAAQEIAASGDVTRADVADTLVSLAAKSLLWTSALDGHVRYRLLDMTRSYAGSKLEERGEHSTIAQSHMDYLLHCLDAADGHDEETCEQSLPDFVGNLRAALEWSFGDSARNRTSVALVAKSVPVFLRRSLLREGGQWCQRALAVLDDLDRASITELSLWEGLAVAGMFTQGNHSDIRSAIHRALQLATDLGSLDHEMRLLSGLHMFMSRTGDFGNLMSVSERALDVAGKLGRDDALAMAEWMLGTASHLGGNQADAQEHCEAALRRSAASGFVDLDAFGYDHRIRGLIVLVRVLWLRGFADQATRMSYDIIAEAEVRGQPVARCIALIYTATVSMWCGDYDTALERIDRLVSCAVMHSLEPYHAVGIAMRGEISTKRGDLAGGIASLRSALATLDAERHRVLSTGFLRALAEALAANHQQVEALAVLDRAFSEARGKNELFQMPDLLRAHGEILGRGAVPDLEGSERLLREAIAEARSQGIRGWEVGAASALARLLVKEDRAKEAATVLEQALGEFEEGFGQPIIREARILLSSIKVSGS